LTQRNSFFVPRTRNFHKRPNLIRIARTQRLKQTMSATSDLMVISTPPKMPAEILDSTLEIATVFERYMAHFAKRETDAQHAALVAFFARQEAKREPKTPSSRHTTYSNIGKTPEAINAIRATNQRNSGLLRLPAELLINI
jgi:hypothetical protein